MTNFHLVFIPSPAVGHLFSAVEFAKRLVNHDNRLSITVFIMNSPFSNDQTPSFTSSQQIKFVHLTLETSTLELLDSKPSGRLFSELVEINIPRVRDYVSSKVDHLSAFVVDMFCTPFIDLANEFNVPAYAYFTSSACFLGLLFQLQIFEDNHNRDIYELKHVDTELSILGISNSVPIRVMPKVVINKECGSPNFLDISRRLHETKGILVNTFTELEPFAIKSLSNENNIPQIYPMGPLLTSIRKDNKSVDETDNNRQHADIMSWLDNQPPSSVVLLCFGSGGCFEKEQVVEIANALEHCGHRFLWSLRRPSSKGKRELPAEYENLNDILPEGFLDRTSKLGKVVGWVPQFAVLSHPAVGGFVSHCGWNSILESLCCGIPLATWPLYAEQTLNAFELVKELELGVEIKMDNNNNFIVTSNEVERGIRYLMEDTDYSDIRKKVQQMSEKGMAAVKRGGSSHDALGCFIKDLISK